MKNNFLIKKGISIAIIILLIGTSVLPVSGSILKGDKHVLLQNKIDLQYLYRQLIVIMDI